MRKQKFATDLWHRDMQVLPASQREKAVFVLIFASLELDFRPHHRASKAEKTGDRQTIFKHPVTGKNCFVLSVVPSPEDSNSYVLRIDFFDKTEMIKIPFAEIYPAPNTLWPKKGERRFIVPEAMSRENFKSVICKFVDLDG